MKTPETMTSDEIAKWVRGFQTWTTEDMERVGLPYITAVVKEMAKRSGVDVGEVWLYLNSISKGSD